MNKQEFWKQFKAREIIVETETQEQFNAFMAVCESEGLRWIDGEKPQEYDGWSEYGSETCISYRVAKYHCEGLNYGKRLHYDHKCETIRAQELLALLSDKLNLTELDKTALKAVMPEYKWLTCDQNGVVYAHANKPLRDDGWGVWHDREDSSLFLVNKNMLPSLFAWCSWENEPWFIWDLLK